MDRRDAALLLGVDPAAGDAEIDHAFRTAARAAHPDRHPVGSAAHHWATARMRRLLEARAALRITIDLRDGTPPRPSMTPRTNATPTYATPTRTAAPAPRPRAAATTVPATAQRLASAPRPTVTQPTVARQTTATAPHVSSAAVRPVSPVVTYRRVRTSALTWVVALLAAALACLAAQPTHTADTTLTWYAALLALTAAAGTTLATRAHRNLATTPART